MGNSLGGKKKLVKVMKVDGTTLKVKPPARAAGVLQDHPGYTLLESEEVKEQGVRAKPLAPDAPLKPGRLYFLVELPRLPDRRNPRRAWSGALHVSAKERLETLMLTRRSMSDIALLSSSSSSTTTTTGNQLPHAGAEASASSSSPSTTSAVAAEEEGKLQEGVVRLRMRLPKSQVEKVVQESKDAAEAAERIMELCAPRDRGAAGASRSPEPSTAAVRTGRKEKRTRFTTSPEEIIT